MCKFIKKLFVVSAGVVAVVGAAAGIYYYLTHKKSEDTTVDYEDEFDEDEFDEDFDIDTQERSYVSLNPSVSTDDDKADTSNDEETFTFTDNTQEADDATASEASAETLEEFFNEESES